MISLRLLTRTLQSQWWTITRRCPATKTAVCHSRSIFRTSGLLELTWLASAFSSYAYFQRCNMLFIKNWKEHRKFIVKKNSNSHLLLLAQENIESEGCRVSGYACTSQRPDRQDHISRYYSRWPNSRNYTPQSMIDITLARFWLAVSSSFFFFLLFSG